MEFLIPEAFAFGVHAQPRATQDLDLFIRSNARVTGFQIGVPPNRIGS